MKSCDKRDAEEKVGVIGKKNGKYNIIEYFEMTQTMREQTDNDGKTLKHRQSYLLMVVLDTNFLLHLLEGDFKPVYHRSHKSIPYFEPSSS